MGYILLTIQIPLLSGKTPHEVILLFDTTVLIKEIILAFYNRLTVIIY